MFDRASRVTAAYFFVVAGVFALVLMANGAFRAVAVGGATVGVVAALRVRIAQQPVGTNARERARGVFALGRLVARALFALVDVLTLSVFQLVTVEAGANTFVFVRFAVAVAAVDCVARACTIDD